MIRIASAPAPKPTPAWHKRFLELLPAIRQHARISFRHLPPERREECVEEAICNACCAVARLAELNKLDLAYATPLGRYAVAQVKDNRRVGNRLCIGDVMSPYCQQRKGVVVERLDKFDREEECWEEILIPDQTCTPAELAASRIDFPAWLDTLSRRDRKVARFFAIGNRTSDAGQEVQHLGGQGLATPHGIETSVAGVRGRSRRQSRRVAQLARHRLGRLGHTGAPAATCAARASSLRPDRA